MNVKDMVAQRFVELCKERNIKINELAYRAGVTPSTAYSMMDKTRRDISITTIKKFCDGLEITLGEFFSTPDFDMLALPLKDRGNDGRNRRPSNPHAAAPDALWCRSSNMPCPS